MKTIIVGDIHGCHAELLALLDAAGIGSDDRIIAIGDVSDRGPESAEVLDFFLTRPRTFSIMGNHEWKHERGVNGLSQRITRAQCGEALYARAVAWMRERPLWLDLPEILLIHWGLMPGVPLEDQHHAVLIGEPAGEMSLREMLGNEAWYDVYEGPKPVAYGHHSWASGARRNLTYGLDTGCVYGLSLTGLLLPEFQLVSVPARENHWEKVRAEWERPLMDGTQLAGDAAENDDET